MRFMLITHPASPAVPLPSPAFRATFSEACKSAALWVRMFPDEVVQILEDRAAPPDGDGDDHAPDRACEVVPGLDVREYAHFCDVAMRGGHPEFLR